MEYESYCGHGIENTIKGGASYCFERDYEVFLILSCIV